MMHYIWFGGELPKKLSFKSNVIIYSDLYIRALESQYPKSCNYLLSYKFIQ